MVFWRCFCGGLFGMPKRFYGVQSDYESVVLAGYAYFRRCARSRVKVTMCRRFSCNLTNYLPNGGNCVG